MLADIDLAGPDHTRHASGGDTSPNPADLHQSGKNGLIDCDQWCVNGSNVGASRSAAGQAHESRHFVEVMKKVRPPRWYGWPLKGAGDKGSSHAPIRAWLERRVIEQVLLQRSDQIKRRGRRRLDRAAYKKRARVQQCVGWLKENRRVGTRYDELASSFHAFVNLAITRRFLRLLASDDPSNNT